ncbi:MAG: ROK family protein [Campylobacterales bacterium]|nr:ROK family protein [Campylobacterales bacterium]
MKLFIDIGGTHLRSELQMPSGAISESLSSQEYDLFSFIEKKLEFYPFITFIGISYAGQIYKGEILSAPNIALKETKIKEYFETRYDLRLEIDNDLNCAVMAEADYFKSDSLLALYVGTGIGSAFIDGGKLVRGSKNMAFEIGHIPYKQTSFVCGCGKTNCLELYASASGLEKRMKQLDMPILSFSELENSEDEQKSGIASDFKEALLFATATLITLTNPEIVVFGGGVLEHNPQILEYLKENLVGQAFAGSLHGVNLYISSLENGAMSGAKLLEENIYE